MPTDLSAFAAAATLAVYVAVMFLPGLLVGVAAGLRGWLLAGSAPVVTYALAGLAGPWFGLVGVPFTLTTFALFVATAVAVAFGVRRLRAGPSGGPSPWTPAAQVGVAVFLLAGAAVGLYTALHGMGKLDAIAQGFDAPLHANGLRYIAETGDGSLHGMNAVHRWGDTERLFYPNAYHLVGSLVFQLTGAPIPAVLNANTVLLPGLLALSLVTMVREFRGRAVLAGAVAVLAAAPATLLYASMSRGPLLPFMLGLALLPLIPAALHRFLEHRRPDTALLLLLCTIGLLAAHTSALFSGVLLALPLLARRWLRGADRRAVWPELRSLLAVAAVGVLLAGPHLIGAVGRAAGDYPYGGWRTGYSILSAFDALFGFRVGNGAAHLALLAVLVVGIVFYRRLGELSWVAGAAVLTGLGWVVVAAIDNGLVIALSRPWWDDPVRLMAIAGIPLTVLAAHGLSIAQAWLRDRLDASIFGNRSRRRPGRAAATTAVAVMAVFGVASSGLYVTSNQAIIGRGYGNPPERAGRMAVSPAEAQAMLELGRRARPGDWAMNDRHDGTVWTYAIGGVRTVAGHYGVALLPSEAKLLAERFNRYRTDPVVRALVRRLNLRWVIVGRYGHPAHMPRQPGLRGLAGEPFLQLVYRNEQAAVYRIVGQRSDSVSDGDPVHASPG